MIVLVELFWKRGLTCHVRSDNRPKFTANVVRNGIEFGEPCRNVFNGNQRDEARMAPLD